MPVKHYSPKAALFTAQFLFEAILVRRNNESLFSSGTSYRNKSLFAASWLFSSVFTFVRHSRRQTRFPRKLTLFYSKPWVFLNSCYAINWMFCNSKPLFIVRGTMRKFWFNLQIVGEWQTSYFACQNTSWHAENMKKRIFDKAFEEHFPQFVFVLDILK